MPLVVLVYPSNPGLEGLSTPPTRSNQQIPESMRAVRSDQHLLRKFTLYLSLIDDPWLRSSDPSLDPRTLGQESDGESNGTWIERAPCFE
jgi:hypothetical protein